MRRRNLGSFHLEEKNKKPVVVGAAFYECRAKQKEQYAFLTLALEFSLQTLVTAKSGITERTKSSIRISKYVQRLLKTSWVFCEVFRTFCNCLKGRRYRGKRGNAIKIMKL